MKYLKSDNCENEGIKETMKTKKSRFFFMELSRRIVNDGLHKLNTVGDLAKLGQVHTVAFPGYQSDAISIFRFFVDAVNQVHVVEFEYCQRRIESEIANRSRRICFLNGVIFLW